MVEIKVKLKIKTTYFKPFQQCKDKYTLLEIIREYPIQLNLLLFDVLNLIEIITTLNIPHAFQF